jgi:predicted RND superfamily exporter protein
MNNLAQKYASFAIKHCNKLLIIVALITVVAAFFIKDLDIRNDPDTLLPPTNKYVATNAYGEQKFGFGNIMVLGMTLKNCASPVDNHFDENFNPNKSECLNAGGIWQEKDDVYQPWFVNMVQKAHLDMVALNHSRGANFMDIAAQKIKYMGTDGNGGLKFERLIPVAGISDNPDEAQKQLAHLKKGIETNPVLAPMLMLKTDKNGKRCEFGNGFNECSAKGFFIVGDYSDSVKNEYLPWVGSVIDLVDEIKAKHGHKVDVRIAGEPYFLAFMLYDLVQKWWLFAISFLIVLLALWRLNKGWRGSFFPLLGVVSTIIITLGLMGLSGYKLTTMMVLTPMLLLAIGTGHAVQVVRRYLSELHLNDCTPIEAAEQAIAKTITPATLAIITDMVGFFTLSFVDISFYKAYAYFGMFGMLTILLTTTTIAPILMAKFSPKQYKKDDKICQPSRFESFVAGGISTIVLTRLKFVPIFIIFGVIFWSVWQTKIYAPTDKSIMPGVEVGINYARAAFKEDAPTNVDLRKLGEVMPGVISVNIPVRGKKEFFPMLKVCEWGDDSDGDEPINKPCWDEDEDKPQGAFNNADVQSAIEKTEDFMRSHPYIGFTGSYIQFMKIVNMLMMTPNGEEPNLKYFHIPDADFISKNMAVYGDPEDPEFVPNADEVIVGFNGLLEANTSNGDLASFVSNDWNEGVIMGFVNTMDPQKTHKVVQDLQEFFAKNQDKKGFNLVDWGFKSGDVITMPEVGNTITIENTNDDKVAVGGFLGATEATRDVAQKEWISSPLITALAIFIIASLIFASPLVAGILTITLLITLFSQYGLGAYFTSVSNWSGNLHFATLVSLSIAMGLGVDYGIYMISRLREEMLIVKDWAMAVKNTIATTGSAVFASILVLLASFIPLLLTHLANTWALGIFISWALIIDVVLALTIIPIVVYYLKPKYVFGK